MKENERQSSIIYFLKNLRETLIQQFESFETEHRFQKKGWNFPSGGGGEMAQLRGNVFEKAVQLVWSVWRKISHARCQRPFFCHGNQFDHPHGESARSHGTHEYQVY